MLLGVGIIAASAFIQSPECWNQVRTIGQDQHGRLCSIESISPSVKGQEKTIYKRKSRFRIRKSKQDWGEENARVGLKSALQFFPYGAGNGGPCSACSFPFLMTARYHAQVQ